MDTKSLQDPEQSREKRQGTKSKKCPKRQKYKCDAESSPLQLLRPPETDPNLVIVWSEFSDHSDL